MSSRKLYCVYLMTNKNNTVIYTGVTGDLKRRVFQHRNKLLVGFTQKYGVTKLVYYEVFYDPIRAIEREKQIKGGSRIKKIRLIENQNSGWEDLYGRL